MNRTPAPGSGSNPRPAIISVDQEIDVQVNSQPILTHPVRYLGSSPETQAMVEGVNEQNRLLAVIANIMKDALALARE